VRGGAPVSVVAEVVAVDLEVVAEEAVADLEVVAEEAVEEEVEAVAKGYSNGGSHEQRHTQK
jgi:hypothetical protein